MLFKMVKMILRYPIGAEVAFPEEWETTYRTVQGYHYEQGAFYVLFLNAMVNADRLQKGKACCRGRRRQICCRIKS